MGMSLVEMMSMNKFLIPGVLVATILVAGAFAFIQIDKASTLHFEIIDAINGFPGVTNQDIVDDLEDKLKLMNATDTETVVVGDDFVIGYNIVVEALNNGTNVNFNLKEVYLCGSAPVNDTIRVDRIYIQNVTFSEETNEALDADVVIKDLLGNNMDVQLITTGTGCVDVISALAADGRAGAMGLGSDDDLAIVVRGSPGDFVDFVKCIAFTPNKADTLRCEIVPILGIIV